VEASNEKRIGLAALLTGGFMVAEVIGGLIAGSLALIADAGHMLTDFGALALAWFAFRMARRPADARRTYGFDRLQVLVAFGNGLALFFLAIWITVEAVTRLYDPQPVLSSAMMVVAVGGLAVNVASFLVLHGAGRENLNMRGAMVHVLGDMLGSAAAIVAAGVIMATGWTPIDPILSVLIALIVLRTGWFIVRDSAAILIEAVPAGVDGDRIKSHLAATIPDVMEVHHLHLWSLTERRKIATLHACLADGADGPAAVRAIKAVLASSFEINHATVEVEYGRCADHDGDDGCGGKAAA
jgi:cobalt-zinc-cadmium efflux system protein